MTPRTFIPALAIACLIPLACDRVATEPLRSPDRASFITNGVVDGNAHPAVVLIVMDIGGQQAFGCSGTLIAAKLVLTAGHCAGEPGEFSGMRIFTESDVENGNNNFPFAGPNTIEAASWQAHPLFTESAFFLHDVGVIRLTKAVKLAAGQYGQLPTVNQLDALQHGRATVFTAVGYGLQRINPVFVQADLIRMNTEPHLIQVNTSFTRADRRAPAVESVHVKARGCGTAALARKAVGYRRFRGNAARIDDSRARRSPPVWPLVDESMERRREPIR